MGGGSGEGGAASAAPNSATGYDASKQAAPTLTTDEIMLGMPNGTTDRFISVIAL
jgi:hypothetical protein